jgi:DNA-binding transcriptional MerR regulator
MIARCDYVGPITKSAEAMFARAERQARSKAPRTARQPVRQLKSSSREVLEKLGLTPTMLRNWESAGLVEFKRAGGRRVIDEDSLSCLAAIIALRRAGFTIRQISWISDILPPSASALREALQARLEQTRDTRNASIARAIVAGRAAASSRAAQG